VLRVREFRTAGDVLNRAVEKVIFNACSLSLVSPRGGDVEGKEATFTTGLLKTSNRF
jgi:hypothetical protein